MRLHVVGNVCLDTSFRLPRLPRPGETLNALTTIEGLGGKGANQAVAAARSGADVCLWSALGNDELAERLVRILQADLDTGQLIRLPHPTDRSTILLDEAGENAIVSAVECARAFDPLSQTELQARWQAGEILLLQGNLPWSVTVACLHHAKRSGLLTALNPSPLPERQVSDLADVDLVIVNQGEASALTGLADPEQAARMLAEMGAASVIITLAGEGSLLLDAKDAHPLRLSAQKTVVVDTSGAGDCFAGTVAGLLAQGKNLGQAAAVATKAAALAVSRLGTLAAYPTRAEFSELLKISELENT
ncbi:ribokinase [Rhizobium sp. AC27/96]|uniref:ribokinase n=1 Tax=Rhizobium sp. AC27/96 TaxID=1841653 RepID=UPI00082786B9|nr:ribokinase [Rhizobium sp. AC27/96]OCI93926.1 ribokinase [Rhizobium sp. AC27/96]